MSWIREKSTLTIIVLLVLLAWSVAANQWTDRGCDAVPQSWELVVRHLGTPNGHEGCVPKPDGPEYTDHYTG